MNLLFYIRLAPEQNLHVVKHPDYRDQEEVRADQPAFFERLSPVRMVSRRVSLNRLDHIIEDICLTLPHVSITMELIDRNNSRMKGQEIYTYLGLGNAGAICAFATLERLNYQEASVQHMFNQIEEHDTAPEALFYREEESPQPYNNTQSSGAVAL